MLASFKYAIGCSLPRVSGEQSTPSAPGHTSESRFHLEHNQRRHGLALPRFADDPTLVTLVNDAHTGHSNGAAKSDNPYALQSDTLAFLSGLLARTAPRSVVEFGSGESTKLFAHWAAEHAASIVSVEHDRRWIENVGGRLAVTEAGAVKLVHAPLRPARAGFRQFMTYRRLASLAEAVESSDLLLLDGPHISGREIVLYFVLEHCRPGAVIVIDDLRHYAVFEMLARLPGPVARCFAGVAIDDNSHGLFVLRCLEKPGAVRVPVGGLKAILRSYWRCFRDLRTYGTGD